jgi:hypothetical protein
MPAFASSVIAGAAWHVAGSGRETAATIAGIKNPNADKDAWNRFIGN